jgi:prepilin-type N-terminal cleavage/methylation domain-containing protein
MNKDSGFSLFELLTAIAIFSILAAIAVPNFIDWRNNAQLSRAARDVYSIFQKAKLEAVRRNMTCTITFSANDYTVYVDSNQSLTLDGGEEVIRSRNWSEYPGVSLDTSAGGGDGLSFANPNDSIAFAPDGMPRNNLSSLGSGTVFLSYQGNRHHTVTISTAGNIRID